MRVAVATHGKRTNMVVEMYNALSQRLFTPASPVLFNAGTHSHHYASCFIYAPDSSDAIGRLASTRDVDMLWLADGGVGLTLANVPAKR